MVISIEYDLESLGNEPKELLGFENDEELENELLKLMQFVQEENNL
tara:strand:- start:1052 stop:1189 length:138 start_codon:yes stop_codon:yes gene_type:complete